MKVLTKDRADLIEALDAEGELGNLTISLLEKDEHLTDALRVVFALEFEFVELVFCGGTSLSKAHSVIERMSEDADLKMVLNDAGRRLNRSRLRSYLSDEVGKRIGEALSNIGLEEEACKAVAFNEHRYMQSHWMYQRRYPEVIGLRPNLQLELTLSKPVLNTELSPLRALADRITGQQGSPFGVPTVSVAETQAEKVLSFLRRFALHRSGLMQRPWDSALVRHVYDVHCIVTRNSALMDVSAAAFGEMVREDVADFGKQHPEFAEDPIGLMERTLAVISTDEQSRQEYEQNLLPLVYGEMKPHFEDAFASFDRVARALLKFEAERQAKLLS